MIKESLQSKDIKIVETERFDIGKNEVYVRGSIDFCEFTAMLDGEGNLKKVMASINFRLLFCLTGSKAIHDIKPKTAYEIALLEALQKYFSIDKKV